MAELTTNSPLAIRSMGWALSLKKAISSHMKPISNTNISSSSETNLVGEISEAKSGKDIMPTAHPRPLSWDIHRAAKRLSVSVVTVRKLIRQQRLKRVPNIRKILIPEISLCEFVSTAE
jgi:hypothetical protein